MESIIFHFNHRNVIMIMFFFQGMARAPTSCTFPTSLSTSASLRNLHPVVYSASFAILKGWRFADRSRGRLCLKKETAGKEELGLPAMFRLSGGVQFRGKSWFGKFIGCCNPLKRIKKCETMQKGVNKQTYCNKLVSNW